MQTRLAQNRLLLFSHTEKMRDLLLEKFNSVGLVTSLRVSPNTAERKAFCLMSGI